MTTHTPTTTPAPAKVSEITEEDIPDVATFLAGQVRPGEAITPNPLPPVDRLRWLLLQNPARAPGIPLGWVIRNDAGAIVGANVCIPFRMSTGPQSPPRVALMFAKFFVDPPYRGMGLGLLMRFVREKQRFPLFCTSTNAVAGELFRRIGARQIEGMDHTMLGIARPAPLLREWAYRRTKIDFLSRVLALPATMTRRRACVSPQEAKAEIAPVSSVDDAADICRQSGAGSVWAVARDREYLRWRYDAGDASAELLRCSIADEPDRLIAVNLLRSGYAGQIRVLNVLDIWPPTSAHSAAALASKLARHYKGRFDALWLRSQPADAERVLQEHGMIRHNFPAPLGWWIDQTGAPVAERIYLMPGESE